MGGVAGHAELAALAHRRWYEPLRGEGIPGLTAHILTARWGYLGGPVALMPMPGEHTGPPR